MKQPTIRVPKYFTKLLNDFNVKEYHPRPLQTKEDIQHAFKNKESVMLVKSMIKPWRQVLLIISVSVLIFGLLMYILVGDYWAPSVIWTIIPTPAIVIILPITSIVRNAIGPAGLLIEPSGFHFRGFFNKQTRYFSWKNVEIHLWTSLNKNFFTGRRKYYLVIDLKTAGGRRKYRISDINHFSPEFKGELIPVMAVYMYYKFSQV